MGKLKAEQKTHFQCNSLANKVILDHTDPRSVPGVFYTLSNICVCVCFRQVDEVVEVDGEVASILSHSRFAEEFTFQPPGVPAGCGVKKPKVCANTRTIAPNVSYYSLSFRYGCRVCV